jgi:delta 1-pyrroline-5-carboxylate dehydrogenase
MSVYSQQHFCLGLKNLDVDTTGDGPAVHLTITREDYMQRVTFTGTPAEVRTLLEKALAAVSETLAEVA